MSSEQLADGVNPLDAELAATWDVLKGYSGRDTDLGIARRFGGAAAAYSLRDIGAMNGRVVKVRRDVDGDGIDKEEDFSANQVQSGALEDWVNGKLESTLPADVDTAAAAYSLRKVKADYSGDAVRIRRSSDDIEVDVAFDSEGKVSASSAITNVAEQGGESGSTNATDLNGFLNESGVNVGMGGNFFDQNSQATINATSSNGFTATVAKTNTNAFDIRASSQSYNNVKKGTVTISYNIVQNTLSNSFKIELYRLVGSDYEIVDTVPVGTTGSRSVTVENTNTNGDIFRLFSSSSTLNNGEVIQISDITITASKHTAFVHTWYDQAGSNDAVQETAANQPKIAENGALLADGLLFDGVNDSFEATDITNVNFPATVVSVSETNKIGSPNTALYSLNNDSNACCGFYRSTSKYAINNGTTTLGGSATYTTGVHRLKFDLFNGASSAGFSNSVSDISGDIGTEVSQVTHFRIAGSLKAGITSPHDGTIKEIILYTSDQSDNRFKIESNINNYYGLYNFQGDGFVETWYDQSGNGNDATQGTASNQPKIVSNGGLSPDGLEFDGSDDVLVSTSFSATQPITSLAVFKSSNTSDSQTVVGGVSYNFIIHRAGGAATAGLNAGTLYAPFSSIATKQLMTTLASGTSSRVAQNGNLSSTGNAGTNDWTQLGIGSNGNGGTAGSGSAKFDGTIEEVIVFDADKISDITEIERDIANYYNITLS
jgi:hypothetical protein